MARAYRSTRGEPARVIGLIVKHQEVCLVPARRVWVDPSCFDLGVIVLESHEEDTIVSNLVICLVKKCVRPASILVTEFAFVCFCTPRISHLYHPSPSGHLNTKDRVSVVLDKTPFICH